MSTTQSQPKTVSPHAQTDELDDRSRRALTEPMTVMDSCGDVRGHDNLVEVTTASGSAYIVDTKSEACTCPDYKHRGVECKHLKRVAFSRGVEAIPASIDHEEIDENLGKWTEGEPRVAMADGGVVAEREPVTETGADLAARIGYVVGVDSKGSAHVHYPAANRVEVFDVDDGYEVGDYLAGEPETTQDLGGRPLSHWMDYVAGKRGFKFTTHRAPDGFDAAEEVSA